MPSSTSGSEATAANRALLRLALTLAAFALLLEFAARVVVPRISNIEGRLQTDSHAAATLEPRDSAGAATVLLVGNSLLLEGVDRGQLRHLMAPTYAAVELPVENTTYWDWYFGLRRLFAAGSHPTVVVVCMSGGQLLSDATDGERFAHTLMRLDDLRRVARVTHLDATTTSEYFFANLSAWLGVRAGVRNAVLQDWLPGAALLAQTLAAPAANGPPPRADAARLVERLAALRQLATDAGAQFRFVVPPLLPEEPVWTRAAAGIAGADVVVLIPLAAPPLTAADFADGFHLNAAGAQLFTARLGPQLKGSLAASQR
jgi:hypothetical protein